MGAAEKITPFPSYDKELGPGVPGERSVARTNR